LWAEHPRAVAEIDTRSQSILLRVARVKNTIRLEMSDSAFPLASSSNVRVQAGWKHIAATIGAVLLGVIFLVSGGWKVLSPFQTGELLEQAQVPGGWGPLGAATLGTLELFAALLLFTPRYR